MNSYLLAKILRLSCNSKQIQLIAVALQKAGAAVNF